MELFNILILMAVGKIMVMVNIINMARIPGPFLKEVLII